MSTLVNTALFIGFFGDIGLQILVYMGFGGKTGWGLKKYFEQHGRLEAMFIAAGMMGLFYELYILMGWPVRPQELALYSIVLDMAFRIFRWFPSLDGYYEALNYMESAIWGAIPMLMVLYADKKR